MLDIVPKWLFLQLINFLVLLVLLNYILFKPLLRLFKERDENINGSLDKAKAMDKEKEDILQQINTKLKDTRFQANQIFDDLGKDGLIAQKGAIDSATKQAADLNMKAMKDLEAEADKAKDSLRGQVESFSKIIVEKMIGV
jgi:F-type H+-transporting ATPase subunit b